MGVIIPDRGQLQRLLEEPLPASFAFGTATAGYQVEGGFNGPDDPKNNWYPAEASGRVEPTGGACRFLDRWEQDVELAAGLGLDVFRMGVEWARIQPAADPDERRPPSFDAGALDHYADILAGVRALGMEPHVTLHHFTHPLWAGLDLWLDRDRCLGLFRDYVRETVDGLNTRLVARGSAPVTRWITLNEPFIVPFLTYLLRMFPGPDGVRGRRPMWHTLETALLAHIEAVEVIRTLHRERGWPAPVLSVNTWSCFVYEWDKGMLDLLRAPAAGVGPDDLEGYLADQRRRLADRLDRAPLTRGANRLRRRWERRMQWWVTRAAGPRLYPAVFERVRGATEPLVDELLFDYYDPFLLNNVSLGGWPPVRIASEPWQWSVVPEGMGTMVAAYADGAAGAPVGIAENGMSVRHDGQRAYGREDGVQRVRMIAAALLEVARAVRGGQPLGSYYHWSLVDNYEWGSYQPRFGLYGVDYARDAARMETDAAGVPAGDSYRELCAALREGGPAAVECFERWFGYEP